MSGIEHDFIGMQWSLCFSPPNNLLMPEQIEIGFYFDETT